MRMDLEIVEVFLEEVAERLQDLQRPAALELVRDRVAGLLRSSERVGAVDIADLARALQAEMQGLASPDERLEQRVLAFSNDVTDRCRELATAAGCEFRTIPVQRATQVSPAGRTPWWRIW